jgi:hypothetical protein
MLRRVDVPESRKLLKPLDPPVKPGDDDIITVTTFRINFNRETDGYYKNHAVP